MSELSLQVRFKALNDLAKPFKQLINTSKKLENQFAETRKTLSKLSQTRNQVRQFSRLRDSFKSTNNALAVAKKRASELGNKFAQTEKPTQRLTQQFERARQRVQKLKDAQSKQTKQLGQLAKKLKQADIRTDNLSTSERQLSAGIYKTTKSLEQQSRALEKLRKRREQIALLKNRFKSGLELASNISFVGFGAQQVGRSILSPLRSGANFFSSFIETTAQFERFETILKTTEGTSQKAKIAMDWVSDFTAKTPFELNEVTDSFVKLRAYGLNPTNGLLKTLGDTGAAMGKPLMQAVEAIADAITGENERLKEFGIKASTKGNTISYTYTDKAGIQKILKVNKNDRQAIQEGLSNIWNEKFSGSMADQSKTFMGIISNLRDQWSRFQLMVTRSGAFDALKQRLETLLDNINTMASNGELQQWASDIGGVLKDLVISGWEFAKVVAGIGKQFAGFAADHPKLVSSMIKFAAVSGAILVVFGPLLLLISTLTASLSGLRLIFGLLGVKGIGFISVLKKIGSVFAWLGRLFLLNPIGLAVTAIAVSAYLLWKYWQPIKGLFSGLWQSIKQAFSGGISGITELLINWSPLGIFHRLMSGVLNYFGIDIPAKFTEFGKNMISGLVDGVLGALSSAKEAIFGVGDRVIGWFKGKLRINSPSKVFAEFGVSVSEGLALGINYKAPKAVESVNRLSENIQTAKIIRPDFRIENRRVNSVVNQATSPQPVVINITINPSPGMDEQAIGRAVANEVQRVQRQQQSRQASRLYDDVG